MSRKILAIGLFIVMGLAMFAFANPGGELLPTDPEDSNIVTPDNSNTDNPSDNETDITGENVDNENNAGQGGAGGGAGNNQGPLTETVEEERLVSLSWEPAVIAALTYSPREYAEEGTVIITKLIEGIDVPQEGAFQFVITGHDAQNAPISVIVIIDLNQNTGMIKGETELSSYSFNLEEGFKLPYGTYTIVEDDNEYYEFSTIALESGLSWGTQTEPTENTLNFALTAKEYLSEILVTNKASGTIIAEKEVIKPEEKSDEIRHIEGPFVIRSKDTIHSSSIYECSSKNSKNCGAIPIIIKIDGVDVTIGELYIDRTATPNGTTWKIKYNNEFTAPDGTKITIPSELKVIIEDNNSGVPTVDDFNTSPNARTVEANKENVFENMSSGQKYIFIRVDEITIEYPSTTIKWVEYEEVELEDNTFFVKIEGTTVFGNPYKEIVKVFGKDSAIFDNLPYGTYTITEVIYDEENEEWIDVADLEDFGYHVRYINEVIVLTKENPIATVVVQNMEKEDFLPEDPFEDYDEFIESKKPDLTPEEENEEEHEGEDE